MRAGLLDWTADPPGVAAARHLRAFRVLLLVHFAVQSWAWALRPLPAPTGFPPLAIYPAAVLTSLACAVALLGRGRLACAVALPVVAFEVAWLFPLTPNHTFLGLLLLALCTFLDPDQEPDEALLVQSLRWIAVLIFFWAGVQKGLHGLYFQGEFLTWMVAQGVDRWAEVFGWMIPDAEIERVRAFPRYLAGAGPYRVSSLPFVLAANGVWLGEIALAVGMLFRRTRELAALGGLVLVFTIQLAPREFMFALLYTNLLLLFVRGEWNRRLLPVFIGAYLYLLAVQLGAPGGFLLRAEGTV
jgi:hypothetical protein